MQRDVNELENTVVGELNLEGYASRKMQQQRRRRTGGDLEWFVDKLEACQYLTSFFKIILWLKFILRNIGILEN